jgi:hypothetical protein
MSDLKNPGRNTMTLKGKSGKPAASKAQEKPWSLSLFRHLLAVHVHRATSIHVRSSPRFQVTPRCAL